MEVHGIQGVRHWVDNIGAGMIANNTILGVPYYSYSVLAPQDSVLIFKAPIALQFVATLANSP